MEMDSYRSLNYLLKDIKETFDIYSRIAVSVDSQTKLIECLTKDDPSGITSKDFDELNHLRSYQKKTRTFLDGLYSELSRYKFKSDL